MGGLAVWAWLGAGNLSGRLDPGRRWENLQRFAGDLVPAPVRDSGDWLSALPWAWQLLKDQALMAILMTLAIACAAIALAGLAALVVLPLADRRLARPDPAGLWAGRTSRLANVGWKVLGGVIRFLFVLARAIPEYLLAFLLISLLGLHAWPLVLALAIHNFGILGRLWGEVSENVEPAASKQLITSGSGRTQTFAVGILPAVFNRFLIYFFYRWETCIKDATVLGMLGLLTLGHLIALSKGFFWDEMFLYVLLGAALILAGDLLSTFVRRWLRG
ncbi:MAG: ABC transporter permease subunit [Verrucomicrobiota bacterium]